VIQGERGMAADNKSLGRFILDGILPAPRGLPQVEVAFDIDANGILHVSARDKGTGREQKITIQAGTGLSPDEIERMKRDAEFHAEEDRKRQEEVQIRNTADSLAYTAEKTVREAGDKIPADVRSEIESGVKDVRDALAQDASADTLRGLVERLTASLQKAGEAVYGQGGPDGVKPEGAAPEGEAPAEEGTVEGEYREV
jgi:molecular chaperone DnaK